MIHRFMPVVAAALAASLLLAACGGGSSKKENANASAAAASPTSADTAGLAQPSAPDKPLPTPTPVPDDGTALTVVSKEHNFAPKLADLKGLKQDKVDANGKSYSGVSIQTLADQVSAKAESNVTIQGIRSDGKRVGIVRFALSEIGSNTVLVLDEKGHLALASSKIPAEQWIIAVDSVSFQ